MDREDELYNINEGGYPQDDWDFECGRIEKTTYEDVFNISDANGAKSNILNYEASPIELS
jgi:hypothetical protein